jgi:predicted deacylase
LNRQAVADGKPTVLVEIGENGRRDQEWVDRIVSGIDNLLRTLRMTAGRPAPPPRKTRWFDGTVGATSSVTGIFTPTASRARMVRKGDPIGTVRSYTGRVREEISSPVDGYVMYGFTGPSVKAGESVVPIARLASAPL